MNTTPPPPSDSPDGDYPITPQYSLDERILHAAWWVIGVLLFVAVCAADLHR